MTSLIEAGNLANVELSKDGTRVQINVVDKEGKQATLALPGECLSALLMTLPALIQKSLRLRHRDPTLRMVFPAEEWSLELGDGDALILSLMTPDVFGASFVLSPEIGHRIAEALLRAEDSFVSEVSLKAPLQ